MRSAYILMDKFGWTLEDMKRLPLSTFGELQELIAWERKEVEREQKRQRGK